MHRAAAFPLLVLVALGTAGCESSDPTGTGDDLDVTGTWRGVLELDITGEGLVGGDISFHLTQNGSAVSGTQTHTDPDDTDTGTVSGTIAGNTLTLEWRTDETGPDCAAFNVSLVFAASAAALQVTGASGRVCDGSDGQMLVAAGTGTLIRQ